MFNVIIVDKTKDAQSLYVVCDQLLILKRSILNWVQIKHFNINKCGINTESMFGACAANLIIDFKSSYEEDSRKTNNQKQLSILVIDYLLGKTAKYQLRLSVEYDCTWNIYLSI